jgi:divalent metal cation (Fe/Co/Zn/Cd) transporter
VVVAAGLVAAGLVAWTGTPWPDLVVAAAIAGLFLQSSWSIVRDALGDLRDASRAEPGAASKA